MLMTGTLKLFHRSTHVSKFPVAQQTTCSLNTVRTFFVQAQDSIQKNQVRSNYDETLTWSNAMSLLDHALQNPHTLNLAKQNALIALCNKTSLWQWALVVLTHFSCEPDVTTYNACISALSRGRQWRDVCWILSSMLRCHVRPTLVTFNASINLLGKSKRWAHALSILDDLSSHGLLPDIISVNASISACARGGQWQHALHLYCTVMMGSSNVCVSVVPDIVSLNSVLSAAEKGQRWEMAVQLLADAQIARTHVNAISFSSTISSCDKGHRWEIALHILHAMSQCTKPNLVTFNAVMSACQRAKQWRSVASLFAQMQYTAIMPDVISFGTIIGACEFPWQWKTAADLWADMHYRQLKPNESVYNAFISACEKSGKWEHAIAVIMEMRRKIVEPTGLSFTAAISACAHKRYWRVGLELILDMCKSKIHIDMITCVVTIDLAESSMERFAFVYVLTSSLQVLWYWAGNHLSINLKEHHQVVALARALEAREFWHMASHRALHRHVYGPVHERLAILAKSSLRSDPYGGLKSRKADLVLERFASLSGFAICVLENACVGQLPAAVRQQACADMDLHLRALLCSRGGMGPKSSIGNQPIARLLAVWLQFEVSLGLSVRESSQVVERCTWAAAVLYHGRIVTPTHRS